MDGAPDVLVVGGDNIFAFDLQPLLESYHEHGNSIAIRDVETGAILFLGRVLNPDAG